jgi:hypothetical protein
MDYAARLRGELALLDRFGFDAREALPALEWTPRVHRDNDLLAYESPDSMLWRIRQASSPWNLRMCYRKMNRGLIAGFKAMTTEFDWFQTLNGESGG